MSSKKFTCPQCSKLNYSFDTVKLVGQCFSCGYAGWGQSGLKEVNATQDVYRPQIKTGTFGSLRSPIDEGLAYLESRNISRVHAEQIGIKWDGEQLYLPIWSPITGSTSWVRRSIEGKGYFHDGQKDLPYVLGRRKIMNYMSCILVEGPFSLLSPGFWGKGFSLLGSNLDERLEKWLKLQNFEEIILWFDPDNTGFSKGNVIHRRLSEWHPNVTRVHGWEFDDRDPGDYHYLEATKVICQARATGHWMPRPPDGFKRRLL